MISEHVTRSIFIIGLVREERGPIGQTWDRFFAITHIVCPMCPLPKQTFDGTNLL